MQQTDTYDWTQFDVHMLIACDTETAYDSWATSAGMESFFAREFAFEAPDGTPRKPNERARVGDIYRMSFHHPADLEGTVLACEPGKTLAISFGPMRVTISAEPLPDGALVRLVQSDIPTGDDNDRAHSHLNCRSCWVYYLLNLRSVIEHNTDLRDSGLPDNPVGIDFAQRWQEARP